MFCRFCGKSVKDGSRFCVYCGKKLANDEAVNGQTQQPKKIRPDLYKSDQRALDQDSRDMKARRHYFSSEQKAGEVEFKTDEIVRQADIQLEQRARQADIQHEQEKLSRDIRQDQTGWSEQGTGRIYSRQDEDRRSTERRSKERQPFKGKRQRTDKSGGKSRLPLLIALIAAIAIIAAVVVLFIVPMFTSSGAEGTIKKLEEALNERDNDKLLECFDRETNALGQDAFTSHTAHAYYKLKISETSETDAENMKAYVTFDIRYNNTYKTELVPLPMVKEGKTWYITKAGWDNVCAEIPDKN